MINPAKSLNVVWPGFSWFRPDRGLQIVVTIIDTIRSDTYKQVMKVATVREFRDKATAYFTVEITPSENLQEGIVHGFHAKSSEKDEGQR